jgi:hypothetical protein
MSPMPAFSKMIAAAKRSAVLLELRDAYFSNRRFEAWKRGEHVDWATWRGSFEGSTADAVARGVTIRRARVVSKPVT